MAVFQYTANTTSHRAAGLLLVLLLTACAAPSPERGATPGDDNEAIQAYSLGRFEQASRLFEEQAEADPGSADRWILRAADAAYLAGLRERSRSLLDRVDRRGLPVEELALARILEAATGELRTPHRLLALLRNAEGRLPPAYQPLLHQLRAEAYLDAGRPYQSALERLALSHWLLDPDRLRENREAMLDSLQLLSARQAREAMARHQPDEEMFGWLALVEMLKSQLFAGQPIGQVIATWRSRFPDHPAGRESIESLLESYDLDFRQPARVALLLPLSGRLPQSARAVRDGFLSAYYSDPQRRSEVVVYDTEDSVDTAMSQFRRAIADGATRIVGPLERQAVTALALEATGEVPVLALNYQDGDAPAAPGVYQFGLLPEHEAQAAAERMLAHGHWRAVTLNPRSPLGDRLEAAFAERFEQLGGVVLGRYRYSDSSQDFGSVIQQAVGVTDAQLRERRLQRVLDLPLSFEPQPRHDLDAIFIGARPTQGRLIKPQLAFYNAGDLPAYATSHVYAGHPEPETDLDLNGLRFCDVPWLLGGQRFEPTARAVRDAFDEARGSSIRLFALGVDAYRLLPYLDWLSRYRGDSFPGATGELRMDGHGRIRRDLDCGVFRDGVVEYEPSPLDDLAG